MTKYLNQYVSLDHMYLVYRGMHLRVKHNISTITSNELMSVPANMSPVGQLQNFRRWELYVHKLSILITIIIFPASIFS